MKTKEELLKIYSAYLPYELTFYPSEKSDLFHDLYADNFPTTTRNYQIALSENDKDAIKISNSFLKQKIPFITFEDNDLFLGQFQSSLGFDVDDVFASEVKPILYSMDMLTKQIEHKGERFILADLIFPKGDYKNDFERNVAIGALQLQGVIKCSCTYYSVVQKLLEYHFNVFDLDESEYIQKQSVIQK